MTFVLCALVFAMGFTTALLLTGGGRPSLLDVNIMKQLQLGKRVVICVEEDATIFEKVGNRIIVKKAVTNFLEEVDDVELASTNSVDNVQSDQSG